MFARAIARLAGRPARRMNPHATSLAHVASVAALVLGAGHATAREPGKKAQKAAALPIVVELFTSEGCSSCPPADEALHALSTTADAKAGRVLVLAWHVDYWDHLGWKDPFGSAFASRRQRDYSNVMTRKSTPGYGVYTPQLIVGGTSAMVGSDRKAIDAAIAGLKDVKATATVAIKIGALSAGKPLHVEATIEGAPEHAEVTAAIVEDDLTSDVKRGENSGRVLRHTRVVRAADGGPDARSFELALPAGLKPEKASVVVFVQQPGMGEVIGAASAALTPAAGESTLQQKLDAKWEQASKSAPADKIAAYEASIRKIADTGVLATAKKVGEVAPEFSLPDAKGGTTTLSELLKKGPVVVTWYRGAWCPFCNIQLHEYQERLAEFEALGATLVAISPQTPDNSLSTAEKNELKFSVLSDKGSATARAYGVSYKVPGGAPNLAKFNGEGADELPLGATYVIGIDGRIAYAFVESDYRKRAEPEDVLNALRGIKK